MVEIAERVLDLPVRRGIPGEVGGLVDIVKSPMYATAVGLIQYAMKHQSRSNLKNLSSGRLFNKFAGKMKDWIKEYF